MEYIFQKIKFNWLASGVDWEKVELYWSSLPGLGIQFANPISQLETRSGLGRNLSTLLT
jgi:hypothetical protein